MRSYLTLKFYVGFLLDQIVMKRGLGFGTCYMNTHTHTHTHTQQNDSHDAKRLNRPKEGKKRKLHLYCLQSKIMYCKLIGSKFNLVLCLKSSWKFFLFLFFIFFEISTSNLECNLFRFMALIFLCTLCKIYISHKKKK